MALFCDCIGAQIIQKILNKLVYMIFLFLEEALMQTFPMKNLLVTANKNLN